MKRTDFYYDLPEELIAQEPLKDRSSSRLMILDKNTGEMLSVEDIKIGDTVNVLLIKDTPITMSLPAQIPGMGIVKIERVKK